MKIKWSRTGLIYRQYALPFPLFPHFFLPFCTRQSILFFILTIPFLALLIFFNQAKSYSESSSEERKNFQQFFFLLLFLPSPFILSIHSRECWLITQLLISFVPSFFLWMAARMKEWKTFPLESSRNVFSFPFFSFHPYALRGKHP